MVLLHKCCFMYSIRRGTYVCAVYTLIYFLLFITLTLNYIYMDWTEQHPDNTNETFVRTVKRINDTKEHEKSTVIFEIPRHIIDLVLEILGMIASILVIIGLYAEFRYLLIPWIVVLPIHTLLDIIEYCWIIGTYLLNPEAQPTNVSWEEFPLYLVVPGLVLSCINVYAYIIVFTQFQEYWAGRGTAAYETLLWISQNQNNAKSRYSNNNKGSGAAKSNQPNQGRARANNSNRSAEHQFVEEQRIRAEELLAARGNPRDGDQCRDRFNRRPSAQFCQKQLNRNQDKLNRRGSAATVQKESVELAEVGSSDGANRPSVRFECEPSFSESPSTQSQSQSSSSHGPNTDSLGPNTKGGNNGRNEASGSGGLRGILTNSPKAKSARVSTIHVSDSDTLHQINIPSAHSTDRLHP